MITMEVRGLGEITASEETLCNLGNALLSATLWHEDAFNNAIDGNFLEAAEREERRSRKYREAYISIEDILEAIGYFDSKED